MAVASDATLEAHRETPWISAFASTQKRTLFWKQVENGLGKTLFCIATLVRVSDVP